MGFFGKTAEGLRSACGAVARAGFFGKAGGLVLVPLLAVCIAVPAAAVPVFFVDLVLMWTGAVGAFTFFVIFGVDVAAAAVCLFLGPALGNLAEALDHPARAGGRREDAAPVPAPVPSYAAEDMLCEPEDTVDVDIATGREWHPYAPWKDADARSHPDDYCVDVDDEGYVEDEAAEDDEDRELAEERKLRRLEREIALLKELMELERKDGDDLE